MPRGDNAREGKQGFQRSVQHPTVPTMTETPYQETIPTVSDDNEPDYGETYSLYMRKTGREPAGTAHIIGEQRCDMCGRFMDREGNHDCASRMNPKMHKILTIAPAVGAIAVFGTAAGIFALTSGYVIPIVIGVAAVAAYTVRRLITRVYAKHIGNVTAEARRKLNTDEREWVERTQDTVDELAEQMNVPGEVYLVYKKANKNVGGVSSPASASRLTRDTAAINVSPDLRDMNPAQLRGILAHEMAHLQKRNPGGLRFYAAKAALPVGLAVGVASGLAVLPAASLAAAVWFTGKMASSAFSRREEKRADREAYKVAGEDYAEALKEIHRRFPQVREDLPWRAEDVVFTHPNLPNRLADMRT